VIAISTSLGARNGLLVKDWLARDLDVVIFLLSAKFQLKE
jgi:hypothetical protein